MLEADHMDLDELASLGVEYVVTSDRTLTRNGDAGFRKLYPKIAAFYDALRSQGEPVQHLQALPGQTSGPTIDIYRIHRQQ